MSLGVGGCLYEPYIKDGPYLTNSRVVIKIFTKNCFPLYEEIHRQPSQARSHYLTIQALAYSKLEFSHINATGKANPPSRAEKKRRRIRVKLFFRFNKIRNRIDELRVAI